MNNSAENRGTVRCEQPTVKLFAAHRPAGGRRRGTTAALLCTICAQLSVHSMHERQMRNVRHTTFWRTPRGGRDNSCDTLGVTAAVQE